MSDNLKLYNLVREVPREAQKIIMGGRLKGMTDINPMWRIKKLTEQFGPCGIGWYYDILEKWIEHTDNGEATANIKINLYYKYNNEWSKPITGIGGSMFFSKEKNGFYTNDECFKMALTDAISVACKALGFGADVYWNKDTTKYSRNSEKKQQQVNNNSENQPQQNGREKLIALCRERNLDINDIAVVYKLNSKTSNDRFIEVYNLLLSDAKEA